MTANRPNVIAELKRRGFTPAEELQIGWDKDPSVVNLQYEWRKPDCRRDPSEIMLAILDALTQEGIDAWPGDATSIVEQIVRAQYERAEKALGGTK